MYDKKLKEYQDQIQTLEIELSEHTKADYDYQTTVATVLSVARRAKIIFENSSEVAGKRQFLDYLLQNCTANGKELEFSLRSPYNHILTFANQPAWLRIVYKFRTQVQWGAVKSELQFSGILGLFPNIKYAFSS